MKKIIFPFIIILLAAASRLLDHPANFTPVVAMSIFAGAHLRSKWGVLIPLAAMLASDAVIGFYDWQVMASVYASVALAFLIGSFLRLHAAWYTVVSAAFISSVVFFILTNFAVWAFFDWYTHDLAGLSNCFTLALPFFRNSVVGDVLYSGILFGGYELAMRWKTKPAAAAEPL